MMVSLFSNSDFIGALGVFLILLAYFLNITNKLSTKDKSYLLLNFFGALLACISSYLIKSLPFMVLEGTWAVISMNAIFNKKK